MTPDRRASPDWRASIADCAAAVRGRVVSVEEIARETLVEVGRVDGWLKAFTYLEPEQVLAEARLLDGRLGRGEALGALAGVPLGVKDLYDAVGLPSSYGGPPHEPYLPDRDATSVARLRAAGALVIGKTRTAEFAWRTVTPPTANPRDPRLVAGGSSGGSAAAVGAGLVHIGLGTDTNGSIRMPAALCGTVGIKPTYGVVSRAGVLPANLSLDTAGPLTRSVADARVALAHLAGHDRQDPASAAPRLVEPLRQRLLDPTQPPCLRGLRLGVVDEPLFEIVEPRARALHERLLERLEQEGVELVRLRLPAARFIEAALLAIDLPEGAALHTERLRARGSELLDEVRLLLHVAHAIPAVLMARGHQVRRDIQGLVASLYRNHDLRAIVAPATGGPSIPSDDLGHTFTRADGSQELATWSYARVCTLASLTGLPALVVPIVLESPPLGVQIIGRPFQDDEVLNLGAAIEALIPL